jgi:hypothetical protein
MKDFSQYNIIDQPFEETAKQEVTVTADELLRKLGEKKK